MTTANALAITPNGQLTKTGNSQRVYHFGFGWMARLHLEAIYGKGLVRIREETDVADLIANVLLAGLKTKPANNLPSDFTREQLYELLDDLSEKDVTEVYQAGMHSLGFTNRILGLSEDDVKKLAGIAVSSTDE